MFLQSPMGTSLLSRANNSVTSHDFLAGDKAILEFTPVPFDHPLIIPYSSGTTGLPKPIVHAGGPLLLQLKKEHVLHCDFTPNDVFFQFTTCAWMMWPWLVGALSAGSTILVFDGSPFKPTPLSLWELSEQENVTAFGTSAKYIGSLEQANITPSPSPYNPTNNRIPRPSLKITSHHVNRLSPTPLLIRLCIQFLPSNCPTFLHHRRN
jgi:acyl-coenzyme A synthetase/AMP-(fatty) acid ligase